MFWNNNKQQQQQPSRENPEGPSSLEKGRCPSISSTQSSIDSPPKAHARLPKATPPPYYSSAKFTTSSSITNNHSPIEFDRSRDLARSGTYVGSGSGPGTFGGSNHSSSGGYHGHHHGGHGGGAGGGGVRTRRPPSFCRRHWFVITVALVILTTCSLAVLGVMLQKTNKTEGAFLPAQLTQPAEGDDPDTFSYYTFTNPLEQDARTVTG